MADLYFLRQAFLQTAVLLERGSDRFLRLQHRLHEIEKELASPAPSPEGGVPKERKKLKQSRHKVNKELQICRAEVENLLRASYDIRFQIETAEALQQGQLHSPSITPPVRQPLTYPNFDQTVSPMLQYAYSPHGAQLLYPVSGCPVSTPNFDSSICYQQDMDRFGYVTKMYTPHYPHATFQQLPVRPQEKNCPTPVTKSAAELFDSNFNFNKSTGHIPPRLSVRTSVALPALDVQDMASSPPSPSDESPKRFGPSEAAQLPPPERRYSAAAVDLLLHRFKTNEKNGEHKRKPNSDPQVRSASKAGVDMAA